MVVTVKVPATPTAKAVDAALVIAGAWSTVNVKVWVASGATPLTAMIVNTYVPPLPAEGVPESVAVPLRLSTKVTPVGSAPVSVNGVAIGNPVVVTVKVPTVPVVNVVLSAP